MSIKGTSVPTDRRDEGFLLSVKMKLNTLLQNTVGYAVPSFLCLTKSPRSMLTSHETELHIPCITIVDLYKN